MALIVGFESQAEAFRLPDSSTIDRLSESPRSRREAFQSLVATTTASCVFSSATVTSVLLKRPLPSIAIVDFTNPSTTETAEAIRRGASKAIPGLGPPDVYFPRVFQGSWKMRREVLSLTTGDVASTFEYNVRFLPTTDLDGEGDLAVADRGFNEVNLEAASSEGEGNTVLSYYWIESNPNDLRLRFRNGRSKDVKVTKRAAECTDTTVFSSEFRRVVNQDNDQGIPVVAAERVLTKWKVVDDGLIQGLELVYNVGGSALGDPLAMRVSTQQQPLLLSKCRLVLERRE